MKHQRMTLSLEAGEMAELEQMAKRGNSNKTEVIRRAVRIYMLLEQMRSEGKELHVQDQPNSRQLERLVFI
ncbi:ribbon-helix-helix domain-containing protein [Lysobacter enzymogenes]|uniref:Ribbon-helix-helix protein, CopG family n=1 Tax=Lysobacter enzymogenes TaxID=69 RepID=A0A3N2RAN0_LYSEN|nr:ribbon-helix-helix domain-containing protein [Lysobacter enzymogenes]ROU04473.1 ribbon-helix-helix protein, CopG family [Lysobacter enzymogenes]